MAVKKKKKKKIEVSIEPVRDDKYWVRRLGRQRDELLAVLKEVARNRSFNVRCDDYLIDRVDKVIRRST